VQTSKQAVLQPQFDGRVIGQDPAAGQGADTGDQVRLLIGEADSSGGGN
jgi:beta-lactam-binding protein with PASTA domain